MINIEKRMENIKDTEYKLLSVKYLFELQEEEGQAADFILYQPSSEIFNKDEYFKAVDIYLIEYNNEPVKRLLEKHLRLAEIIIEKWNKIF
jgi:superfamily II helicase